MFKNNTKFHYIEQIKGDSKIKKDPFAISLSLVFNLNLLEEGKEYNINELKFLTLLDNHWITIKKYLKIFNLIQEYCPEIELKDSKLKIKKSKIYERLSAKEKFIIYLYNRKAFDDNSAVPITKEFTVPEIYESLNYLYKKTNDNRFYLTKSGINHYNFFKNSLSDLIYNEKKINEVFEEKDTFETYKFTFKNKNLNWMKISLKNFKSEEFYLEKSITTVFNKIFTDDKKENHYRFFKKGFSTTKEEITFPVNYIL